MAQPPRAKFHTYVRDMAHPDDPARFLVDVGTVKSPGDHSAGQTAHARPYLVSGSQIFIFPIGLEGFRRSGTSGTSIHKYLGQVAVDVHVFHREEARIEMSGTFPGLTADDNMVDCEEILRSKPPLNHLVLYAPGAFNNHEQFVVPETWDFTHSADDRSHSIDYTITFIRTGEGKKIKDVPGKTAPPNPQTRGRPRGKPDRFVVVGEGARTLKQLAHKVYKDANKWKKLVALNQDQISLWQRSNIRNQLSGLPTYQIATYRWPIGTRFRY